MTIRWTLIGVILIALLSQPLSLLAQQTNDWAAVKALAKGQEIRVETKAGKKFDGKLDSVSDERIQITSKGKIDEVAFVDVKKVHSVKNGARAPEAAIGAALGAGIGTGLGLALLASTGGSDDTGGVIAPFIAVGAGLGALAGALMPRKKRTLIYEAK